MITTPLLTNAEGKQRWPYIVFGISCMALATLCWITFDGTKSLPDLQEIDVGQTQPGVKGATWQGLDYPLPMNAKGKLVSQDMYPLETFGGQIEVLNGYKVWKPRDEINGLTVYHGSNARVDAKISNENYQGIWFSPDFACAMGAGTNTAKDAMSRGGDVVIVEYVLKNSVDCKPFLLLGIGSRNNADILFENGFKTGAENEVFITMGRGSQDISVQLAEFCKNDNYCGWRSPYDQNEIFICNKCMKVCLKSTQTWYKVDKYDVQDSMEEVYWFPNQQPMNTVGSFVIQKKRRKRRRRKAKSILENLNAGKAALYNGDTLAYYAYSIHVKVTEVTEESTPSHMTTKDESIPPKRKPNDENDASIPVVQNDCDQTIGLGFLYVWDLELLSTYNCKSRFLYGKKKVAWRVTPPPLVGMFPITEEDEDLDEPITPKSEPKTPKSDPKSKLEPSTPKSNPPTSESDPIIF